MQLIEKTSDLEKFCAQLNNETFVCVDLEFMREHTYFAQLCLIQIACPQTCAIIDPLSPDIDLQSFFNLMQNPQVTKVFHSGRQDIEIIYQQGHCIPTPLFDSQIAASAIGLGDAISYEHLVKNFLNINMDKSSRLSDWSKRPLAQKQLEYAIGDVTYLAQIYPLLLDKINKLNRLHWIDEELQNLSNPSLYQTKTDEIWMKIHHRSHNKYFLTLLRELAEWREKRAIRKNTPRQSLLKDEILLNICSVAPKSKQELCSVRGLRNDLAQGIIGDEIISVVNKVNQLDEDNYVTDCNVSDFSRCDSALLEILRMALKITAAHNNVATKLIASDDDLKEYCCRHDTAIPFMEGWRYEIFGKTAAQIASGKTAIFYNADKHNIELHQI